MVNIQVDYNFYQNEFKGNTIPSALFDKYIQLVQFDLLNVIGMNLYDVSEDETEIIKSIKLCECSLAEFEYKYGLDKAEESESSNEASNMGVGEIKSESAGSTSRTYVTTAEIYAQRNNEIATNPQKFKMNIINRYLGNTGLLYRGLK